ncbi:hypothetical protein [Georgenia faecalis]|uniref:hypothetical protein n=1 Tax=Georgenia faecalis TaxID=2483799 RepID=UPI000FDC1D6D|nr:hypothetical protein [Georgenia faecalis]
MSTNADDQRPDPVPAAPEEVAPAAPVGEEPAVAGEEPAPAPPAAEEPGEEPAVRTAVVDPATLRRAPRYGRFAGVGVLLGALVAFGVAFLGDSELGRGTIFLLLLVGLGSLGALVGALLAVRADRRSVRDRGAR